MQLIHDLASFPGSPGTCSRAEEPGNEAIHDHLCQLNIEKWRVDAAKVTGFVGLYKATITYLHSVLQWHLNPQYSVGV